MSTARSTLATLHQSVLQVLKRANKSYVSLEEQAHTDPYLPILKSVTEELNAIKSLSGEVRYQRLKGLEQHLAHLGLAEKAVASSFEDSNPGRTPIASYKDPLQTLPGTTPVPSYTPVMQSSFFVPGTEKPRTGINAFSGTVGGDSGPPLPQQSQGGGSFAARDKNTSMPTELVGDVGTGVELDRYITQRKKVWEGYNGNLPGINLEKKPLDPDSPSDQQRAQVLATQQEEARKREEYNQRDTTIQNRVGSTHILSQQ